VKTLDRKKNDCPARKDGGVYRGYLRGKETGVAGFQGGYGALRLKRGGFSVKGVAGGETFPSEGRVGQRGKKVRGLVVQTGGGGSRQTDGKESTAGGRMPRKTVTGKPR